MPIVNGSQWHAVWSRGNPNAMVWTVRGVTVHGVYITSPGSRSPGHLYSENDFRKLYAPIV
jgi:hypothetical protein